MITEAIVRGINDDKRGFSVIKTIHPGQAVNTDALVERLAHVEAASWLNDKYPGQWCYRYADLIDDVTVETHGAVVSYRLKQSADGKYLRDEHGNFVDDLTQPYLDGVTNLSLVKDGGFNGQFQWVDGGVGGYVPASVDTVDPEREARHEAAREAAANERAVRAGKLTALLSKLPAMTLAPYKEQDWQTWKDNNQDGYGGAVIFFADAWARLMENEINQRSEQQSAEATIREHAARLDNEPAEIAGLTGFQYGAAVNMLSQVWLYGEELRRWHNKEYGHEGEGVVNPALLTISGE